MANSTTVYSEVRDTFNVETGEVTSYTKMIAKKTKLEVTDQFVKTSKYLTTIFAYMGIPLRLVPIALLISEHMDFKTNKIALLKELKIEMSDLLGYKRKDHENTNTIDREIAECVKYDILRRTKSRGLYVVNPYLFATGSTTDVRNLQAVFDFDNEQLTIGATTINMISGEVIKKIVKNVDIAPKIERKE